MARSVAGKPWERREPAKPTVSQFPSQKKGGHFRVGERESAVAECAIAAFLLMNCEFASSFLIPFFKTNSMWRGVELIESGGDQSPSFCGCCLRRD
jgi:hypothetical protein